MTTRTCRKLLLAIPMILLMSAFLCLGTQPNFAFGVSETVDIQEPEYDDADVDKVIDFATVDQVNISDDMVKITVTNNGDYQIRNWSVVFNANFKVGSIKGAELISAENAVQFKHLETNSVLNPGDSAVVKLGVDNGRKDVERFRVYAACSELSEDYAVNDVISYDCETGEEKLMCSDEDEFLSPEEESNIDGSPSELLEDASTYAIIGSDGRQLVRNVNIAPYRSIGRFVHTFSNGKVYTGTAFMIGNRHALTSAHCLYSNFNTGKKYYNVKRGYINFGEAGSAPKVSFNVRAWRMSAAYKGNPVAANDWACLITQGSVYRGYFKVGFASPSQLMSRTMYTAGYPGDKYIPQGYRMYRASGRLDSVTRFLLTYKMDTVGGQSGSPVYDRNYYVYGVHSGSIEYSNGTIFNRASYLNPGRVKYFKKMRWCGGGY